MDQIRDYEKFRRLVMRLCVTFDKFANDELIESWWKALRQERIEHFEKQVDQFIAVADGKTKFPKPGQFRGDASQMAFEHASMVRSQRNWREFCGRFPKTGPLRLRLAQAAQVMASSDEFSPQYAQAQHEYLALENMLGPGGRYSVDA